MKKLLLSFIAVLPAFCYAYTWNSYGPDSINANNICFNLCGHDVICAAKGICVNDDSGGSWNYYSNGSIVWEAVQLDADNALIVQGNGAASDGIYKFNFTSHQFSLVRSLSKPRFIKLNPNNNLYYVGKVSTTGYGLYKSSNGLQWDSVPYFQNKLASAIAFYNTHITVARESMPSAVYFSNDGGVNWTASASAIGFRDLIYNSSGKLFAVCPGPLSTSSGLNSSVNYGSTWYLEYFMIDMSSLVFDIAGDLFIGWHSVLFSGIGVQTVELPSLLTTSYDNLLPCRKVNKLKSNLALSTLNIYCCTDSGVYCLNNYPVKINDLNNSDATLSSYPNPFNNFTTIEYSINETSNKPGTLTIFDSKGQKIKEFTNLNCNIGKHSVEINTFSLNSGIYYYILKTANNTISRKMICVK